MCQLTIVLIYQLNFYRLYNICGKLLNFSIHTIQERFLQRTAALPTISCIMIAL